ncbi:MAG: hypothetical protein R3B59_07440 [Dehalococcoidia bacterium]
MTMALRIASRHVVEAQAGTESLQQALDELRVAYAEHEARDGFAETCWSVDDVRSRRPEWTEERAREWLLRCSGLIQDAMVEAGWGAIDALLDEERPERA